MAIAVAPESSRNVTAVACPDTAGGRAPATAGVTGAAASARTAMCAGVGG